MIHNLIPDTEEVLRIKSLGEEIGQVLVSGHEGDDDLVILNAFAYKEVATLDVLHLGMMLWIVGGRDGRLTIAVETGGLIVPETEVVDEGS